MQDESPSALQRLSIFIHGRTGTKLRSRQQSDLSEVFENTCSSPIPIQSLIKKSLSKTAKGSSIIRRDDSVVITKNGKIVSVRSNREQNKAKRDGVYYPNRATNRSSGASEKGEEKTKENGMDVIELESQLENGFSTHQDGSTLMKFSKSETSFGQHNEALDDLYDTEFNSLESNRESNEIEGINISIQNFDDDDGTDFEDNGAESSGIIENFGETTTKKTDLGENSLLKQPPALDSMEKLIKNDFTCDTSPEKNLTNLLPCKSTDVVFKVPFLRCPSQEHLDIPSSIQRSASDLDIKSRNDIPQYKRRWTFSKDSKPQFRKKKTIDQ